MAGQESNEARDAWLRRLKHAVDAGYYRTESAEGEQTAFPWQGHTCGDCPFWLHDVCTVYQIARPANAHTCRYFDRPHREQGRARLYRRRWELLRSD